VSQPADSGVPLVRFITQCRPNGGIFFPGYDELLQRLRKVERIWVGDPLTKKRLDAKRRSGRLAVLSTRVFSGAPRRLFSLSPIRSCANVPYPEN